MSDSIVRIRRLVKNYESGAETLKILRDLDFDLERGFTAAIRGMSGCGKSTLLNILGGLDRCDSGTVEVAGTEISSLGENALTEYRRSRVGFVFQFHYLLRDFTALENVMLPAYIGGAKKDEAMDRAASLLKSMGLESRGSHYPSQLSGGERQRIAVARSMVNNPDLILADEPTGNLDPQNSAAVADMLYAAAQSLGKSLIVVTHDRQVALKAMVSYELAEGILEKR